VAIFKLGYNMQFAIRVASCLSPKYRTLAVPVSVAQNIELFTHALYRITVNVTPNKELKQRTARLNTGHLATLFAIYNL